MRARNVFELTRQHVVDRRPMPFRERHEHVALIPRHPNAQQHEPDRLRQYPRRVILQSFALRALTAEFASAPIPPLDRATALRTYWRLMSGGIASMAQTHRECATGASP